VNRDGDWEGWFWFITSALVVVIVIALHHFGVSGPRPSNASTGQPTTLAHPSGQVAPDVRRSSAGNHSDRPVDGRIATVFECRVNGQHIYSDQRCGSAADERVIHAPNRMDAQDTSILSTPDAVIARSRSERSNAKAPGASLVQSECASIEEEKNSINARMRHGYTSSEGEGFRDRLRFLGARYYDLRCRHFH
jgi:hypothetical protein